MASSSTWRMAIDQWEATVTDLIIASHTAFVHEKYSLQLHVETNPVLFRPSTVLSQLIQSEQRRGTVTRNSQRHRTKNAEYLERKLESEVRQHYELESAQTSAKWKKLHSYLMEDRRQLHERIDWDSAQLSHPLHIKLALIEDASAIDTANPRDETHDGAVEVERQRRLVEREWIHQERFNIQEAFTNQTKKIQADYQAFLDQLDVEFIAEREKILASSNGREAVLSMAVPSSAKKTNPSQLDRQFKSNTKRHMLVHTAPVVDLVGSDQAGKDLLGTAPRGTGDMTLQDTQLQELEHRLATFKEAAEVRLRDGKQWIARQCAHMFSQLDCKEAEATLVTMLMQQNEDEATKLHCRVRNIASQLRQAVRDRIGQLLPPVPSLQQPPLLVHPIPASAVSSKTRDHAPRRRSEPVGIQGARQRQQS